MGRQHTDFITFGDRIGDLPSFNNRSSHDMQ